jgi:hypothetical protein
LETIFDLTRSLQTDIGGAMQRQSTDMERIFPFIFGINSFGVDCGFGIPLVTSRVASFIPWIDSIVYPNAGVVDLKEREEPEAEKHFQGTTFKTHLSCGAFYIERLFIVL